MLNVTGRCIAKLNKSITKSNLENMLDTVIGNDSDDLTYVTPDHFAHMYPSEGDSLTLGYELMLQEHNTVANIWTNHAPCRTCVRQLINHFTGDKPTIHIARLLNVHGSQNSTLVTTTLQCLAKLAHNGFGIKAWDMEEFRAPLGTPVFTGKCGTLIHNYNQNVNFTVALYRMARYIDYVNDHEESSVVDSWC